MSSTSPPLTAALLVENLSVSASKLFETEKRLLYNVSFELTPGQFTAVIGPSGCGKSTLVKALAGELYSKPGQVLVAGYPVWDLRQAYPLAVGYLPQFGTFHRSLTVKESLRSAADLRLPGSVSRATRIGWLDHLIKLARLEQLLNQRVSTLSGGQIRRLALVEELIGDPPFLLLDELTSGLDAFADREMMEWLKELAHGSGKTVILVTHATSHLAACDNIIFLHQGRLIHLGPYSELLASHNAETLADLFGLYHNYNLDPNFPDPVPPRVEPVPRQTMKTARPPGVLFQFPTVLIRHFQLLFRDWQQLSLHLLLLFSFPVLVAIFAQSGLPQVRQLDLHLDKNVIQSLSDQLINLPESLHAASLVSGMTLFQVILLTLLGSNNGSREIARERNVLGKERRAGLSAMAYVLTKFIHVVILSTMQALWMAWFVKTACAFPGSLGAQFLILEMTTIAMSTVTLAISAASSSAERASLLAIYLVGIQLPLSGATLALPEGIAAVCRPFIDAYWGWSGYLKTMSETSFYDNVRETTNTPIAPYNECIFVLSMHIIIGLIVTWWCVCSVKPSSSSE